MITYKDNMEFIKVLKKEWGISSKIICGYKIDKDKYTHTNVIFHGIRDKLLPSMLKGNTDAYYIEDDPIYFRSFRYTQKRCCMVCL